MIQGKKQVGLQEMDNVPFSDSVILEIFEIMVQHQELVLIELPVFFVLFGGAVGM